MINLIVVVPEYGHRDLTRACIESIKQDQARIFVGNDNYPEALEPIEDPRVTTIDWSDNLNFGGNVNRTVAAACSSIPASELNQTALIIVNTDVVFRPRAIAHLVSCLDRPGLYGPTIIVPDKYNGWNHPQIIHESGYKPNGLWTKIVTMLSGACLCTTADLWFILGGFDCDSFKAHYEDDDLCLRAHALKLPVEFCYQSVVSHTVMQTIDQSKPETLSMIKQSKARFCEKWPEIRWDSSGMYPIPYIRPSDLRILYRGPGYSKYIPIIADKT